MFTQVLPFEFDIIYISEREKKKKKFKSIRSMYRKCFPNILVQT